MIRSLKCVLNALFLACFYVCSFANSATATISLSGTQYLQNFSDFKEINNGSPSSIFLSRGTSNLFGLQASFDSTERTSTFSGTGFHNNQNPSTNSNRLLGIRPATSGIDASPTITLTFLKTEGFKDFKLSFDFFILNNNQNSVGTWEIRCFKQTGVNSQGQAIYSTPLKIGSSFGTSSTSFSNIALDSGFENHNNLVFLQFYNTANTGNASTARDLFGFDNVKLTFTRIAVPEPSSGLFVGLIAIGFASLRPSRSHR